MILYVLLAAFVVGLAGGAGGMNWWNESRNAARERALAEAQAKIDQLAQKAQAEAANKLVDMSAAYEAGESKARVIYRTIEKRGADYVASNAVFANPQCRIPLDGVLLLAAARTGTDAPALAPGGARPVSGAGAAPVAGNNDGGVVPANAAGPSPMGGVSPPAGATGGASPVPATGARRVVTNPLQPK